MKKFIKHLILFLLPVVVLGMAAEVLLRRIPNNYKFKRAYLDRNSSHIQTLILGNSHFFYGMDPAFFHSDCFNAGNVSQPLEYDYLMLKKYDKDWKRLSKILIPIDYFTLYSNLEDGGESWRKNNYKMYFDINADHFTDHVELFNNNLNISLTKIAGYYLYKEPALTCSALGWGTSYRSDKKRDLVSSGRNAAKRHTYKDDHLMAENLAVLRHIIQFAEARHIKVIMITPPTYKTYYENLNKVQLQRTLDESSKIARYFHLTYINLLKDRSFDENDFFDADHVNEIGAKKLSLKVDSLLFSSATL
ncbi:hypothetical protein [Pedobacter sp.]|uniref:hypothetical protein n=1 Tax=Pedobacter sp. TaxID=1411316 RepID=UPI003D7FBA31